MLTLSFLLVVCSGLLNAVWNLYAKRSLNKTVFLWSIHIIAAVIFMPYFVYELASVTISPYGYMMMALSMVFQGLYFFILAKAYAVGDLSQVYPIMRGTGALLIPIISVLFMDERLTWIGWVGLAVLLFGIFNLSGWNFRTGQGMTLRSVGLALAIGCCITGYTLADKIILQFISPFALIQVSHIGYLFSLTLGAMRSNQIRREWEVNWRTILLGVVFAPGSYLLFLFALDLGQVAQLAPIREIGIVFGALMGVMVLKEKQGFWRIVAAVLITAGVITIEIWG